MGNSGFAGGTLALLFTDVEGSTRLWEAHPEEMGAALRRHDALMREACVRAGGHVFKTIGDAFCVAFATAGDALNAALEAQNRLVREPWPASCVLKVRMAIHAGTVEARDDDYFGPPLNRVARLVGAGHGGQVLLSQAAHELVRDQLPPAIRVLPLGEHRLKDLTRPEPIFQILAPGLPEEFPPIRSLASQPNNLPLQSTSFIGRERELVEVQRLIEGTRLLTLTGAGGTGKTRLSMQVAAENLHRYPDGVWVVELAPLGDPGQVAGAIAEVLDLKDGAHPDLVKRIAEAIGVGRVLLVLDNCEHVIDAIARVCDQLLRVCPHLTLMTSSREPLRVPGEQTYRVPPLSLPRPEERQTLETISQYESARLFIDRALLHNPSFQVTNENAPDLAMLVAQLDGIPLALELAAARVRSLPVRDIARRLDQRFQMLTSGVRTALPRQQTLRALVDWSYELLSPAERVLLARLSVFAGGFDAERAEAVGAGDPVEEWECFDLLSSLVDKSLVMVEDDGARYRLQETIRQYGEQKLREAGEEVERRNLHLRAFATLAEEARPHLHSSDQLNWVRRIKTETDNCRAALRWGFGPDGDKRLAVALAAALSRYWYIRGAFTEGEETVRQALDFVDAETPAQQLSDMHNSLGLYAFHRGDHDESRTQYLRSAEFSDRMGASGDHARIHINLGNIAYMQNDLEEARRAYDVALDGYRAIQEDAGIGLSLNNMACVLSRQGDLDGAEALGREGLDYRRRVGDPWNTAYSLMCLSDVAEQRRDFDQARALAEEALQMRREISDEAGIGESALSLARIGIESGTAEHTLPALRTAFDVFQRVQDVRAQWLLVLTVAFAVFEANPALAAKLIGAVESSGQPMDDAFPDRLARTRASLPDSHAEDVEEGKRWTLTEAFAKVGEALAMAEA